MQIAPAHGDVALSGGHIPFFIFRPNFRNIASLGEPKELVALFASVVGESDALQSVDAMAVLWACAADEDQENAAALIGYMGDAGYVPGAMEDAHKIHIARHLLMHGMVGVVDKPAEAPRDEKPTAEFKASHFVALAVAHLGMSTNDAWGLSMTALVDALNAKFPQVQNPKKDEPGGKAPTMVEHEKTMAWFESVKRSRSNGK